MEQSEFPPEVFLWKVERSVSGFSRPHQHHHVTLPQSQPLPQALLNTEFMFVHDDTSKPPLALLYSGPYKVLKCCEKLR